MERRQRLTMKEALKSGAIVSSLFPEEFKKKLMEEKERELDEQKKTQKGNHMQSSDMMSKKLSNVMAGGTDEDDLFAVSQVEEMADLYPDCTILFADIAVSILTFVLSLDLFVWQLSTHRASPTISTTGFHAMELETYSFRSISASANGVWSI